MEEFSALGALEDWKGFIGGKHWNVFHRTKTHSKETQIKATLQQRKKGIETEKDEKIDSVIEGEGRRGETLSESCGKMETNKSETNIPEEEVGGTFQNTNEDIKEKTEECEKSKESSTEEELHNEVVSSTIQEWINHLPAKRISREEGQVVSQSEDNPAISSKLSREASIQSSSSLDSILDSRRPDPVEIFLNLGFGGVPGVNMENCRIPKRFLVPSKCKGGDWDEFLKRELLQAQNFECSSLGFRGLSGPSYRRPSAIVANIMEKLRERATPHQPHPRSRFSMVAKRVLNEKSVLNKLSSEFQSVLSPDNRKFLQNQGKKSPEVPRRRIIFGQKSFAFAHDGEFVEVEPSGGDCEAGKENSAAASEAEDPAPMFPSADVLLKLRRPSLQKQKKVEEDGDTDDVFYIVGKEGHSGDNETCGNRYQKAGKIPRRFLSSTNLKAFEEKDLTEAMRLEVEKEILNLSQKVKCISNQDLPSVLKQVKQLRSRLENTGYDSSEA